MSDEQMYKNRLATVRNWIEAVPLDIDEETLEKIREHADAILAMSDSMLDALRRGAPPTEPERPHVSGTFRLPPGRDDASADDLDPAP